MLKTTLRPHQIEGVEKSLPHPGFCLFMEQRTGKTLTALAIVEKRKPRLLMIVTVKNGKKVWKDQIAEHLEIDWPMQVVITHFQELHLTRANWRKLFREYTKGDIMVICDESHLIKRRGSQAARIVRSLGKLAAWRLALTGTPLSPRSNLKRRKRSTRLEVTDGLEDIWSQFDFIDPTILGTAEEFESRYLVKGGFRGFKVVGYRNKSELRKLIEKYSYRKLLGEVQEQKTKIRRVKLKIPLTSKTRGIYEELDKKMNAFVNGVRVTIPLLAAKTQKLQQVASGFLIDRERDKVHRIGTEKLQALERLLRKIFSQGHGTKVVICAKFIPEIEAISKLISRMGLTHQLISGKSPFSGKFEVDVTVIQVQSGVAIDLSEADTFIFYSCSHKHTDYEQARFRVLSFDKQAVVYYYLLASDTVDEIVYEATTKKRDLTTLVLDHYRRKRNEQSDRNRSRRCLPRTRLQRVAR